LNALFATNLSKQMIIGGMDPLYHGVKNKAITKEEGVLGTYLHHVYHEQHQKIGDQSILAAFISFLTNALSFTDAEHQLFTRPHLPLYLNLGPGSISSGPDFGCVKNNVVLLTIEQSLSKGSEVAAILQTLSACQENSIIDGRNNQKESMFCIRFRGTSMYVYRVWCSRNYLQDLRAGYPPTEYPEIFKLGGATGMDWSQVHQRRQAVDALNVIRHYLATL